MVWEAGEGGGGEGGGEEAAVTARRRRRRRRRISMAAVFGELAHEACTSSFYTVNM